MVLNILVKLTWPFCNLQQVCHGLQCFYEVDLTVHCPISVPLASTVVLNDPAKLTISQYLSILSVYVMVLNNHVKLK